MLNNPSILRNHHRRSSSKLKERDIFALIALISSTLCYLTNIYLVSSDDNESYNYNGLNINTNTNRNLLQSSSISSSPSKVKEYKPSVIENYFIQNSKSLGLETPNQLSKGCKVWNSASNNSTTTTISKQLQNFRNELYDYMTLINNFDSNNIEDLRLHLTSNNDQRSICNQLEIHPDGLEGIFKNSGALSKFEKATTNSKKEEFMMIEPLFPPLRHPEFCYHSNPTNLMRLDYIIHDFKSMCQQLKPTSKIIMIDMGASLDFHDHSKKSNKKKANMLYQPAVYLTQIYAKFGFKFDHIYAFEVTPTEPSKVYDKIPSELLAAYHWINVGVSSDPQSKLNPLKLILENYNEDDLIIVKLDIDTPEIEMALVYQLLETPELSKLVDQFYFEHHVKLRELADGWRETMRGSVGSSLRLFQSLRQKGIAAHYWV